MLNCTANLPFCAVCPLEWPREASKECLCVYVYYFVSPKDRTFQRREKVAQKSRVFSFGPKTDVDAIAVLSAPIAILGGWGIGEEVGFVSDRNH